MAKLLLLLLVIASGLALGPTLAGNKGYVLIAFDRYTLELSLSTTIFLLIASVFILFFCFGVLKTVWRLCRRSPYWWGERKQRKAQQHTQEGVMALLDGEYQRAEKLVSRAASYSNTPALNYLTAAEAAAQQGQNAKRDDYLLKARSDLNNQQAVILSQARFHLQEGHYQQALDSLNELPQAIYGQRAVVQMRLSIYTALHLWQRYLELLPSAEKLGLLDATQTQNARLHAQQQHISSLRDKGADTIQNYWANLSKKERKHDALAAVAANTLIDVNAHQAAYAMMSEFLNRNVDVSILNVCQRLRLNEPQALNKQLHALYQQDKQQPALLRALACQCMAQQLWKKAEDYLTQVLDLDAQDSDYALFAEVKRELKQSDQAQHYYRKALGFI